MKSMQVRDTSLFFLPIAIYVLCNMAHYWSLVSYFTIPCIALRKKSVLDPSIVVNREMGKHLR